MYLQEYLGLRRRLLLENFDDYTPARLRALASDPAQFDAEFAAWEERHAVSLNAIANVIEEALTDMANGITVADAHATMLTNIHIQRIESPQLTALMDSTDALSRPLMDSLGEPTAFINTLRVLWICVQTHDILTIEYTEDLPVRQREPERTPARRRHLTRKWIASNFKALHQIWRYVDSLIEAIEGANGSIQAARSAVALTAPNLPPDVIALMDWEPFLRQIIEIPEDDEEFRRLLTDFAGILPC